MTTYSASFNFPNGFLWGIVPPDDFLRAKDINPWLYTAEHNKVSAILLDLPWADCEPVKGNYDEAYIDTLRSMASRIHSRNIAPFIILNTTVTPQWQNLDDPRKADENAEPQIYFAKHMIDALVPYTNYFCLTDTAYVRMFRGNISAVEAFQTEITEYLHNLSSNVKLGLILSQILLDNYSSVTWQFMNREHLQFLRTYPIDFVGIPAEAKAFDAVRTIFNREPKPVMFMTDKLKKEAPKEKADSLANNLYDIWNYYQSGCQILGYFSETELTESSREKSLYVNSVSENAFQISTDNPDLPDKWIQFLKD